MNHLAHFYLARTSDEWMVGGFIADNVKGKKYQQYDKEIAEGILLHRFIDGFTDSHELVHQSKSKLRGKFGLLSGLIVDVIYDHFLAKNWKHYSEESLEAFTLHCYSIFDNYATILPEKNRLMLPYMRRDNWLLNYSHINGISRAFEGMSRRIKFTNKLYEAPDALIKYYDDFEAEFMFFFPLLEKSVTDRIQNNYT